MHLLSHSVEKCCKTRSLLLRKNQHFFREIEVFTKEVTKELISRNFFLPCPFFSKYFVKLICIPFLLTVTQIFREIDFNEIFSKRLEKEVFNDQNC